MKGGHYMGDTIVHKVIRVGYCWPTLFKYAHAYAHKCPNYQRCACQDQRLAAPLLPIIVEEQFQ